MNVLKLRSLCIRTYNYLVIRNISLGSFLFICLYLIVKMLNKLLRNDLVLIRSKIISICMHLLQKTSPVINKNITEA